MKKKAKKSSRSKPQRFRMWWFSLLAPIVAVDIVRLFVEKVSVSVLIQIFLT